MGKIYIAYGSNCNIKQMQSRCFDSILIGTGYIEGYELRLKGVATILPKRKSKVPVTVWSISEKDEHFLDIYEGVKNKLYRKENIRAHLDNTGEVIEGMVYILNGNKPDYLPSIFYFEVIMEGYKENNLPIKYLLKAYESSFNNEMKESLRKYKGL